MLELAAAGGVLLFVLSLSFGAIAAEALTAAASEDAERGPCRGGSADQRQIR